MTIDAKKSSFRHELCPFKIQTLIITVQKNSLEGEAKHFSDSLDLDPGPIESDPKIRERYKNVLPKNQLRVKKMLAQKIVVIRRKSCCARAFWEKCTFLNSREMLPLFSLFFLCPNIEIGKLQNCDLALWLLPFLFFFFYQHLNVHFVKAACIS